MSVTFWFSLYYAPARGGQFYVWKQSSLIVTYRRRLFDGDDTVAQIQERAAAHVAVAEKASDSEKSIEEVRTEQASK